MKRDRHQDLIEWKSHPLRKPLIIRGARQVGKTWLIEDFAKEYDHFVNINFEKQKSVHKLFEGDLDVTTILERLAVFASVPILPGKTLLFFDEIQECIAAVQSLRYFKEEAPDIHVIAAGSLLDFALEKVGLPVGRVQFMFLGPLSFGEFLTATGHEHYRESLLKGTQEELLHEPLLELVKSYLWIGGMPAVVKAWRDLKDVRVCQELQDEILLAYRTDIEKYAKKHQVANVKKVFTSVPAQLGAKFKYVTVDPHVRAQVLREALHLLEKARIIHFVYHTSAQKQPLGAMKDELRFKVFFFDVGLAQRMLGLDLKEWILQDLEVTHLGAIMEQFVAQEVIAYTSVKKDPELFYWHKEDGKSNAEVDFITIKDHQIIPLEVKAGAKGKLKSLAIFLQTHPKSRYGLKVSQEFYHSFDSIKGIPFYGIESWFFGQ